MPLHIGKGRSVSTAISAVLDYVEHPEKTDNGQLITSWQCDSRTADSEFLLSKKQYATKTGRHRGNDDVIAYHLRQSFRPGEITPEEANRLGCELVKRFTKEKHAYVVCTHIDKAHIHNHIIWNSKGAGYAWFAKKHNLKQMAQTMLFLEENDLLDEAVLTAKVEEVTAKYHELSDKIKSAEKRMAEISILQKHIRNYRDTKKVYVDYRKAGYSKKFREEHEDKILLHQAAKKYFDELDLNPLPDYKSLTSEYAKLMAEKKALSPDYYRTRDQMRELQIAKANVVRVMEMEIEAKSSQKVR